MKRRLQFIGFVALALALVWSGAAMAGTTGKINGVVKDQKGAPLPGASVVIEGTKQGAIADANGYYVIINVAPGVYKMTASLIGYDRVNKSGVSAVADQTTTLDFALKETAVQMSEVTVVAERPLVEPDKTTSKYVVTAQEIERIGIVRSTQDLLQLQPGVSVDGDNRLRGSNVDHTFYGNDVAYIVDGVRINFNDSRSQGGKFQAVNRGAIQELSVITGVMPAEYGNTQAGVINIVTKEGENRYHGWGEGRFEPAGYKHWGKNVYDAPQHLDKVRWNDPNWTNERHPVTGKLVHQRTDYERWSGWQVEGNASGPIGEKASFVVTAKHDRYATPFPGPEKYGFYNERNQFIPSGPNNVTLSGSFTLKPSANLKLKVGGLLQRWRYWNSGNEDFAQGVGTVSIFGVVRGLGNNGKDLFLPAEWSAAGEAIAREELQYAVFTHTLSPKTFYEVRLSRSRSNLDTSGVYTRTTVDAQDVDKWFSLGRVAARWKKTDRLRYGVKFDISSQVTKGNFVKAGVELLRSNIYMIQQFNSDPSQRKLSMFADGMDFVNPRPVHPLQINAYAQDKMEFQGMIVNLGVRMDAFSANVRTQQHGAYSGAPMFRMYTRNRDYMYDKESIWSIDAPWHITFSPRLGISHPITSKAQIRFSSGVFLQYADMYFYYARDFSSFGRANDTDINKNGRIDPTEQFNELETTYSALNGTPLLRPVKSTNFEVGMDWNFVSDYTAALTTYYKSEVDQLTQYPNETWSGARDRGVIYSRTMDNGAYGDTRGIELALKKAFSQNFSFQVSYNMQWAQFTTGKLGNVIRNVYMDSLGVANLSKTGYTKTFPDGQSVFVPDFWIFFDPSSTGREIPRKMTEAEIKQYGAQAQAGLNGAPRNGDLLGTGVYDGVRPQDGPIGQRGVYILTGGYSVDTRNPKAGDRRSFGSVTLLMSLPDGFKFGPAFVGNFLSNVRMTLINRLETGSLFLYQPPQGGTTKFLERGMDTRTDLAAEKTFRSKGRFQPTLFVDVRNLFNQQDRIFPPNSTDYFFWGLNDPRPDETNYVKYGDVNDRNYANFPRRWNVGMRFNW